MINPFGRLMAPLRAPLRGLAHRGSTTIMILAVALVATAAAATGPTYYSAARASILKDTVTDAPASGRGIEASATGAVPGLLGTVGPLFQGALQTALGHEPVHPLFQAPVYSVETAVPLVLYSGSLPVIWRSDFCAHLKFTGRCPTERNQVLISQRLAGLTKWHIGQRVSLPGLKATITGLYKLPNENAAYWFGRGTIYFSTSSPLDAMFTPRSTLEQGPAEAQGSVVVDDLLNPAAVSASDVPRLKSAITALQASTTLGDQQIIVSTSMTSSLNSIQSNWRSVAIPIVLITAQLLLLCLLLLFLSVTDATDARGAEVALVKLRGYGRARTLFFGLSEPVLLLLIALPAGTLVGWGATISLCHLLLRPGTPVVLPWLAWAVAAVATLGGLAAVVLAARRTLRRPVVEQLRKSSRQATSRGWVVDGVVATAAVAGLLEIYASGQIGSAKHGALGLLVPGLLGLAVAVVGSRLLPLACRGLFGRTSRKGSMGLFLAIRHVARRPGGVRTTIVLATAFALATFAIMAWAVGRSNRDLVAQTRVGAPTVLTVTTPPGKDLSTIVDRADPGGTQAATVDKYVSLASGSAGLTTLAVDPQRFAQVASWKPGFTSQPLTALASKLNPPSAAPVFLTGDAMRVTVDVHSLAAGSRLSADVATGASPVELGTLPAKGSKTLTSELVGCPCMLVDLDLAGPIQPGAGVAGSDPVIGSITVTGLQVHGPSGWRSLPGVLTSASHWRAGHTDTPPDQISASKAGVSWKFTGRMKQDVLLNSANRPDPLPAVISSALLGPGRPKVVSSVGLDGSSLNLGVVSGARVVPGAAQEGVIVDRRYAEIAASLDFPNVQQQVWLAAGAQSSIEPKLTAAGVKVLSVDSAAQAAARLGRQGPALASVLFLADAAAAALLAAGAAILGLYLSARRRRYEYAALSASGVNRRTLRRAVLTELGLVLGFGSVIGIVAGLGAAVLALRSVPEFTVLPSSPPLSYVPDPVTVVPLLAGAVLLLIIAAVTASITLIRGVKLEQLREAPA
jgi:putative ABC transport system permease protein